MSTFPSPWTRLLASTSAPRLSPFAAASVSALLAILGIVAVWPTALVLWGLWTTDPLKSIGMLVPIASLALILRAWRAIGWQSQGTWWGLAILVATAVSVYIREHAVLVLVVAPQWNVYFPPNSLVAFAYVSGAVLLFGGTRLFRAALFPICLIVLVNPVPHIFNVFVDLPLQRISAHVARSFAHALGQPLTPDQMRLMFTPNFGMFIAPGCNGIRGAVTMGMIALIVGYLYRFRWHAHAVFVVCAVLLGYLFNFVRLCTLVLYYIVALHLTALQPHGELADYIIGACLFLFATWLLTYIVRRAGHFARPAKQIDCSAALDLQAQAAASSTSPYPRYAAMAAFTLLGAVSVARAYTGTNTAAAASAASGTFPEHVGSYTLVRSWNEVAIGGPVIFHWADYAPPDGGAHVALGISPTLGAHDTLICHSARGEDPVWHAALPATTPAGLASFSAAFFADGVSQYLEVTTLCQGDSCGEYSDNRRHFGFVYSRPKASALFSRDPERPIPVMLRAETTDTALPADMARAQLTGSARAFLASLNLNELTRPYRH